jgi:hypothetical protein
MNESSAPTFVTPLEVTFTLGGQDVTVRPATVGRLARMIAVAGPLVRLVMALQADTLDRLQSPEGPTTEDVAELFETLSEQPEKLLSLVALAADISQPQVEALAPDQFAYLFAVVVQVNADFFSRATPVFAAAGRVLRQVQLPQPAPSGPAPSAS